MARPRIVIALDPERVSSEAIELGHALGVATGAPLGLLAVWRWWEPVELAMIAGESLRERPTRCSTPSPTGSAAVATTSRRAWRRPPRSGPGSTTRAGAAGPG